MFNNSKYKDGMTAVDDEDAALARRNVHRGEEAYRTLHYCAGHARHVRMDSGSDSFYFKVRATSW